MIWNILEEQPLNIFEKVIETFKGSFEEVNQHIIDKQVKDNISYSAEYVSG